MSKNVEKIISGAAFITLGGIEPLLISATG